MTHIVRFIGLLLLLLNASSLRGRRVSGIQH
ncbi:leu operon leader peptide [Escherichia coli]|nr:leu operon leader peptide [Escherichia coli]ELH8299445.1 leu operon leader peptide [Escherichia coli]MCM4791581.1 leu operon leader peptide [Escherichia coli]HAI0182571.1 leu operon leader peptide [Escherichia coli]HDH3870798.1 leu operon leader peptide [Escherichia coli]